MDTGTPTDAGADAGTPADAGLDAGTPEDAGLDAGTPEDTGADTVVNPDVGILLNPDFEEGNTDGWYSPAGSGGSVYADNSIAHGGDYSLALEPGPKQLVVTQNLDTGQVVNRSVTISGWMHSSSADRGLKLTVALLRPTGWDGALCGQKEGASHEEWSSFSKTCDVPDDIYAAALRLETTGTSGILRLDDLAISATGSAPDFAISKSSAELGSMGEADSVVMVSTRHHEEGRDGFLHSEVYTMEADGSNATRITNSGWGHLHPAVSPDRKMIAVPRHTDDVDGDGVYVVGLDPQALWILDLENGEEWQLLPSWNWSGYGGVDWSPDSQWVYFAMSTGRYTQIYKMKPDGTGLAKLSEDTNWQSDIGVSNDGTMVTYQRRERKADSTLVLKTEVWVMNSDGTDNHQVTDGGPEAPQMAGDWPVGDYDPEFGHDDTHIVFGYNFPGGNDMSVNKIGIDGDGRTELCEGKDGPFKAMKGISDWNADDVIVFTEWSTYQGCVTVNSDGTNETRIEGPFDDKNDGGTHCRWIP